jgi:hypothetical protein
MDTPDRPQLTPELLNQDCFCISLDDQALTTALAQVWPMPSATVFSARPVFVAPLHLQRMAAVVQAIERVVGLPAYRQAVLAQAPAVAQLSGVAAQSVLFGYDFHLSDGQLDLIEVNTNAGGVMLNAVLARAQRSCCADVEGLLPTPASVDRLEQRLVAMFQREWALCRPGERPLASVAIVDEAPEQQALYPEFLLFQRLLQRHGIRTVVVEPSALAWRDGRLWKGDLAIDLVYNRLTDFYLAEPAHAALRQAWQAQGVVLTPHPQAHALYADKRLLALFSDIKRLQALGVSAADCALLQAHVPPTEVVQAQHAERLWAQRRSLFFKPVAGYGGRAAYRGDKLTRRVWDEILAGDYVAQALRQPGERRTGTSPQDKPMKFDLRAYVYAGEVLWVAARVYQGQTTNFRTPGGGFAPVYSRAAAVGAQAL